MQAAANHSIAASMSPSQHLSDHQVGPIAGRLRLFSSSTSLSWHPRSDQPDYRNNLSRA